MWLKLSDASRVPEDCSIARVFGINDLVGQYDVLVKADGSITKQTLGSVNYPRRLPFTIRRG